MLPDQRLGVLPGLLDAVLEGAVVRSRRALRGRGGAEHPRVFIWGLLEARLQTADVMVLGGLVEGVWPPASDPGPWLSRPMRADGRVCRRRRKSSGSRRMISSPAVCAAPTVVLSCPRRRDGAPAVPARWLTRLETLLGRPGAALPEHPAAAWVRALDQPADGPRPVRPPRPCPPVALRPRQLSVTEIETWLRDPYAIYARHVLRLAQAATRSTRRPMRPITARWCMPGMRLFLEEHRRALAGGCGGACGGRCSGLWRKRVCARRWRHGGRRGWIGSPTGSRRSRRSGAASGRRWRSPPKSTERYELARPGGLFTLIGRADRIEQRRDGGLAILDYKTGTPPTQKDVDAGLAPQLLLEAAMAEAGAFGDALAGHARWS